MVSFIGFRIDCHNMPNDLAVYRQPALLSRHILLRSRPFGIGKTIADAFIMLAVRELGGDLKCKGRSQTKERVAPAVYANLYSLNACC